jgi:hypothetical protein
MFKTTRKQIRVYCLCKREERYRDIIKGRLMLKSK